MVRLLLGSVLDRLELLLGFNPTMVRLLPGLFKVRVFFMLEFQSHNGAIAAPTATSFATPKSAFQSHNGAIAAHTL